MRCQTCSTRLWARGRDSPSLSLVRAASKRVAKRSTMPRSFSARSAPPSRVEPRLVGVGGDDLVQLHGLFRLRLDRHGGVGVELPVTLAADDQVAIVVLAEPADGSLGSDAAVDDHGGAGRRVGRVEHAGQGAVFADVAGEDLRAAHEAAGIEHQTEGEQGAIAAPLFRVPALGLRLLARLAFEIRVGHVVEGDGRLQVEEPEGAVKQVRLDRVAMLHQLVRGAVELHGADGLEGDAEQLAEAAALLQPAVRLAFGGWVGHAGVHCWFRPRPADRGRARRAAPSRSRRGGDRIPAG